MKTPTEQADEYAKQMDMDTKVDRTNVMEKLYSLPNIKHKWLFRLHNAKVLLGNMVDAKNAYIQNKVTKDNPLNLSKAVVASKAETQMEYKELQKNIREQEMLVEYLDTSVQKIFSQMGYEIKSLVDLIKIEEL